MKRSIWALLLGSAVLLAACTAENDDWRAAQAADTSLAYSHFASQHPDSSHAAEARSRAAARAAAEAVVASSAEPTAASVVPPVAVPQAIAPATAPSPPQAAPPQASPPQAAPAQAAPPPAAAVTAPAAVVKPPAPASRPAANKAAGFGVQIGAFSTQDKAEAQWRLIQQRHRRELAGASHQIAAGKAGSRTVYRLKLPQPSQAAAKDLCRRLSAAGQPCVVYHP